MSTLKVLEQTFGKYAEHIHRQHVTILFKNVMDELNTKINENYQYNAICKKYDALLLKVLIDIRDFRNILCNPLPTDIPSEYNISLSEKEIHLKNRKHFFNVCYCAKCFSYWDKKCLDFAHCYFNDPRNYYFKYAISNIKSDMDTLKMIHRTIENDKKSLKNNFDDTVYNYYKSKVPVHLQQLFGLK